MVGLNVDEAILGRVLRDMVGRKLGIVVGLVDGRLKGCLDTLERALGR